MNYFENCTTRQEVKTQYYKLAMQYHPDRAPEDLKLLHTEIMKTIISQYEQAIKKNYSDTSKAPNYDHKNDLSFVDIINKIFEIYPNAVIEITGLFLWILKDEKTREFKDTLKNFMKYSKNKKQWYFTPLPYKRVKQTVSMQEIRDHYGSKIYKNEQPEPDKITA